MDSQEKKTNVRVEQTAGAVLFRRRGARVLYLLLQHTRGHWAFPKGHIEEGETPMEAARREIKEEANISRIRFLPGFKETIRFRFSWPPKSEDSEARLKFVVFYLGQVFDPNVAISDEHKNFQWVPYEKARKILKHKNVRVVLERAHARITKQRSVRKQKTSKPELPASPQKTS